MNGENATKENSLAACPFCGGDVVLWEPDEKAAWRHGHIECRRCCMRFSHIAYESTDPVFLELYNRREA